MRIEIPIECKHCKTRRGYKKQKYTPKDIKNIPKKPTAKCKLCNKYITINRNYIIDYINKQIKKSRGSSQTQTSLIDQDYQLKQEILKFFSRTDITFHGLKISQHLNIHYSIIYKHINWLKDNGYINQTSSYPNFYQLTSQGKFYMKYGITDLKTFKQIQNKEQDDRINKYLGIIKEYIHNLSFRLPLDSIPNWLLSFKPIKKTDGKYKSYSKILNNKKYFFKPIILNNWPRPKYYAYIDKTQFGGLDTLEINLDSVAFNFNRERKDCLVSSASGFINYFKDRENDVKKCKDLLTLMGFKLIGDEPILHKKPHIVIETKNDISSLSGLGKWVNAKIIGSDLEIDLDNSPPGERGEGEAEIKNVEKGFEIIQIPEKIEDLEDKIKDIEDKITSIDQILDNQKKDSERLDKFEKAIVVLANQNQQVNDKLTNLTNEISTMNKSFENLIDILKPGERTNQQEEPKLQNDTNKSNYYI